MGDHFCFIYKRVFYNILFFLLVLMLLSASVAPVYGQDGQKLKTVKVGYFYAKNYQEGKNDSEEKSGYGYEYLQQVANYAGWKCQYVYGSWNEIYQKLQRGEVDIMSDISYTPQRRKQMLFSTLPISRESYYLYVPQSKERLYEKLTSLKGKTVAVTPGLVQTDQLKVWNRSQKAGLIFKYYKDTAERTKAFEEGKTDMILDVNIGLPKDAGKVSLRYIGSSNTYFAVSKKRADLLGELNNAVATLISTVPRVDSALTEKYNADTLTMNQLPVRELSWFNKHKTIRIGYKLVAKTPWLAVGMKATFFKFR